jgi:hypothetical protein
MYVVLQMRQALFFISVSRPFSIVDKVSSSTPFDYPATKNPPAEWPTGLSCSGDDA